MCGEKVLYSFGLKQVSGITPAYAGKRSPALFPLRSPEDHPRVCGEKKVMRGAKDKRMGSPPHVRGKAGYWVKDAQGRGITPACAGKRKRKTGLRRQAKDHPRMCGEKRHTFVSIESGVGSPPHVRGKGPLHLLRCRVKGITPACAGKSEKIDLITMYRRDHPRMCGEKARSRAMPTSAIGSPPHVRGKVGVTDIAPVSPRITPACAGKSTICGEWQQTFGGSPPHVRGKDMDTLQTVHDARITPACAGKRLKRSRSTVPPVAIVPLFPSVCNKPVVSDGSPAGRDAPLFLPAENAVPASPAYNLRSL